MMESVQKIALTLVPGLGTAGIRHLVELFPDEDIFALPPSTIREVFGRHRSVAESIVNKSTFARAEQEAETCRRNGVRVLFVTDSDYPQRLNQEQATDSPVLLFAKGDADLNAKRTVAMVGTRKATLHGMDTTAKLVQQLNHTGVTVVSGLAYGIDTASHRAAVEEGLPTVAVLGHGLDRIYPAENSRLAASIVEQGGALLTEYLYGSTVSAHNFPARNRIIAALSDATVVVEAASRGGALITAAIANSYQREVFAVPGRIDDAYSEGTNGLIATNKAMMVRSGSDICYQMGWPQAGKATGEVRQESLFPTLNEQQQRVVETLRHHGHLTLDEIGVEMKMPIDKVAAMMFHLEMMKAIRALPGRLYEAI